MDSKQTVMVVDDSQDVRELVALQLRLSGYEVVEARDGREAVELAKEKRPALIVMDMQMPVMDGLAATRAIRQIDGLCGIPIVAFSAFGMRYHLPAIEAGCDEYVSKDSGLFHLMGIVRQYLPPA